MCIRLSEMYENTDSDAWNFYEIWISILLPSAFHTLKIEYAIELINMFSSASSERLSWLRSYSIFAQVTATISES